MRETSQFGYCVEYDSAGCPATSSRIDFPLSSSGLGSDAKNSADCWGIVWAARAAWSMPSMMMTNGRPSSAPRVEASRMT